MQIRHEGIPPIDMVRRIQARTRTLAVQRGKLMLDALEDSWRKSLGGSRSGRSYRYKGRTYRASAPGEAPAERSGRLRRTIRKSFTVKDSSRGFRVEAFIGSPLPYATFLDRGTTRMRKRPIFDTVLRDAGPRLRQISRMR